MRVPGLVSISLVSALLQQRENCCSTNRRSSLIILNLIRHLNGRFWHFCILLREAGEQVRAIAPGHHPFGVSGIVPVMRFFHKQYPAAGDKQHFPISARPELAVALAWPRPFRCMSVACR